VAGVKAKHSPQPNACSRSVLVRVFDQQKILPILCILFENSNEGNDKDGQDSQDEIADRMHETAPFIRAVAQLHTAFRFPQRRTKLGFDRP